MDGRVVQLTTRKAGAMVTANAAVAATTLFIDRTTDFNDLGGQILLGGFTYLYDSVVREVVNPSIHLTSGLSVAATKGNYLDIQPESMQRWALIDSTSSTTDDAVWALVPHDLSGWLSADGPRATQQQEQVTYEQVDGQFVVTDVLFKQNALGQDTVGPDALEENSVGSGAIAPDSVLGEALADGSLDGMTITGALIRTRAVGKRVQISDPGLVQFDDDGVSVKTSIGDVNKFTGNFDAETMTIQDQLVLRGTNNVFASGSKVTLQSNQVAPNQPASLMSSYDEIAGVGTPFMVTMGAHMDSAGSNPKHASNIFGVGRVVSGANYYQWPNVTRPDAVVVSEYAPQRYTRIYYGGGERLVTILDRYTTASNLPEGIYLWTADDSPMGPGGTTAPTAVSNLRVNSFSWFNQYALGRVFDTTGTANRDKFAYGFATVSLDSATWSLYGAVLAPNGSGGYTTVHSASWASFPRMASDEKIVGINYGSSQRMKFHGSDQFVWVISTTKWNYVYNLSGTTRLTDLEFPLALINPYFMHTIGDLSLGDFNGFRTQALQSSDFKSIKYTDITWSGDGTTADALAVWWVKYRWRNKLSEATMRETVHGPAASVLMKKRSKLFVTSPAIPPPAAGVGGTRVASSDVWAFRHFVGRGTAEPGGGSMWLQSPLPLDLTTSIGLDTTPVTSGTSLLTAFTSFVGATPMYFESSDLSHDSLPKLKISGDGQTRFERVSERYLPPRVWGELSADQAIGTGAWTTITNWSAPTLHDATRPGADVAWSITSGQWTLPEDGFWRIEATIQFGTGTGGTDRFGAIYINNAEYRRFTIPAGSFRSVHVWAEGNFPSSTVVGFRVFHNAGVNVSVVRSPGGGTDRATWYSIRRISDRF